MTSLFTETNFFDSLKYILIKEKSRKNHSIIIYPPIFLLHFYSAIINYPFLLHQNTLNDATIPLFSPNPLFSIQTLNLSDKKLKDENS
jgi:hypothetical protein